MSLREGFDKQTFFMEFTIRGGGPVNFHNFFVEKNSYFSKLSKQRVIAVNPLILSYNCQNNESFQVNPPNLEL